MKQKKYWVAVVENKEMLEFSGVFISNEAAKEGVVGYLHQHWNFDGDDIQDACSWAGDCHPDLDFKTFEVDVNNLLLIEPPNNNKNHYRVVFEMDAYGVNKTDAASAAWNAIRADDVPDPLLMLIDNAGNVTQVDMTDVFEFNKVTPGFVTQRFRKSGDGLFKCIWQEFTAGDDVQYENPKGETVQPPNYDYQEFNMTLQNDGFIIFIIREVLQTLDVGGEQSRQFAEEITKLKRLINRLAPGKERQG